MTRIEEQFFSLLRSGLRGGPPDASLFGPDTDWEALYRLSFEQTVVPLVTDGIHRLPASCLPDREERLDPFLGDLMTTEARNGQLDRAVPKLLGALSALQVVLVKGQGVAVNYPDPLRRQPGDIDLLLTPDDYHLAREILLPKASRVEEEAPGICHQGMFFGSIEVELHGTIATLMSRSLDRDLAALQAEMFRRDPMPVTIGGKAVPLPDPTFHALYIFVHFIQHYWSGGLGIRQIIDWAFFLEKQHSAIDMPRLREAVESLGMSRLWHAFLGFAAGMLAFPSELLVPYAWNRLTTWRNGRIWRYIRRCGNFGKNQDRSRGNEAYLVRKIHSFWQLVIVDRLRHAGTFPLESLRFFAGATGYGLTRLSRGE